MLAGASGAVGKPCKLSGKREVAAGSTTSEAQNPRLQHGGFACSQAKIGFAALQQG
jgi:hypothetical protein